MYDYIKLRIDVTPQDEAVTDLLAAFLADEDFESFEPDETGLSAYVRKDKYRKENVQEILKDFPMECDFSIHEEEIKGEDWNKEWEQNYFQPICIADRLLVRSSFHNDYPRAKYEIIIDPKMAFGTGHHSTTALMAEALLDTPMKGKSVIDMGTGTGILAILAKKLGAGETTGIDIDEFAIENARENGDINGADITWIAGDDKALEKLAPADIFLANINLNVIKENLEAYISRLKLGGEIFLSGFLTTDKDAIMKEAARFELSLVNEMSRKEWQMMAFKKEKRF